MSTNLLEKRTDATLMSGELANKCIFSVDVEDWFHILQLPGAPQLETWDSLPSLVERNFMRLLDVFGEADVRVTCFFLGWVAQRYPHLAREASKRGHEIASHGYAHRLVFEMTSREFRDDAIRSRHILEDVTGKRVTGYRAAGFSATGQSKWFFERLLEAGYDYDSSIFPAARQHGGMINARSAPHSVATQSGPIFEFPISVAHVGGQPVCFFGGGYLRLFPYWMIRRMAYRVIGEGRPVIFYIHPREIDISHPRLSMPIRRKFKSYINLGTTEGKIRRIISEFQFVTFQECLKHFQPVLERAVGARHGAA